MSQKNCKRCQEVFECKANEIAVCQCTTIQLTNDQRKHLAVTYDDCLCLNCLAVLSTSPAANS